MIIVQNNAIIGNTAPNIYGDIKPWTHESGAAWWVLDQQGEPFIDADGQTYIIRKRTQAEIEATPEFAAWLTAQQRPQAAAAAKIAWGDVPAWLRTYTANNADDYIFNNVNDLASAKTVLRQMARALILFRDYLQIRND